MTENTTPQKLLVLGIGNMLLTDDGVGVFAAQKLLDEQHQEQQAGTQNIFAPNVTVLEAGTFTQDIFYLFEGYAAVLVLDIVHAKGTPGTIYTLSEADLVDNEKQRLSIHDVDLIDSLNMAERLHGHRPILRILGMEPYDYTSWNIGLSEQVQAKFEDFLHVARQEILSMRATL